MTIEDALQEFHLANRANGLSVATQRWYTSILSPLAAAFSGRAMAAITTRQLREYVIAVRERTARYENAPQRPATAGGLSRDSIDGHIRALKRFFEWAAGEYDIPNPARGIKRPKPAQQPVPKALAAGDFVPLFNAATTPAGNVRDRAMLAVLADTGCRLGGLLSMSLETLDLVRRRATVTEKGGHQRRVYFTHFTAELVRLWTQQRRGAGAALWTSITTGEPLTAGGVHEMLRRLKDRAKVRGRVNPHAFRHNFAREYIRAGGDVVTLAKLLGHSSVEVTAAYYAVFAEDELQEFHDKHSPMKDWEG